MATTKGGTFKLYQTYSFRERDPICYRTTAIVRASGLSHKQISDISGVATNTLWQWEYGKTKRPQFATIMAVLRACGHDLEITKARPEISASPTAKVVVLGEVRQGKRKAA